MQRTLQQFDSATGEMVDGFIAVIQPKQHNGFGGWFAMNQNALKAIRQAGLQGRDYDVLFCLLEYLDFENLIQISQQDIANELQMERSHVNRSIKRLAELGLLLEGPKIGRSRTYRLNPSFGWKGSAKNHREALEERARTRGLGIIQGGKKTDSETNS